MLDKTGKHSIEHDNLLEERNTVFELTQKQQMQFKYSRMANQYLQHNYHTMHESVWDVGYSPSMTFPDRYLSAPA